MAEIKKFGLVPSNCEVHQPLMWQPQIVQHTCMLPCPRRNKNVAVYIKYSGEGYVPVAQCEDHTCRYRR